MVKMFIASIATEDRNAFQQTSHDHDQAINQWYAEDKERRCHFSTRVDRKHAEHEAKKHRPCIAHEHARRGEIEKQCRQGDGSENKSDRCEFGLIHAVTQRKKSNREETDRRECAHLSRNTIEPVQGIHREPEPDDREQRSNDGRIAKKGPRDNQVIQVDDRGRENDRKRIRERKDACSGEENNQRNQDLNTEPERRGEGSSVIDECEDAEQRDSDGHAHRLHRHFFEKKKNCDETNNQKDSRWIGESRAVESVPFGKIQNSERRKNFQCCQMNQCSEGKRKKWKQSHCFR